MNVTKLFVGGARTGELTHLRGGNSRISRTPGELEANVADFCAFYRECGIRSGDSVLVLCSSRVESVEAILAAINIGATAVPTSSLIGATHLCSIIERMRPRCCVFEDPPEPSVQQALDACGAQLIAIRSPAGSMPPGCVPYREILGRHTAPLVFESYADDHRALVIHGSGSSGSLKAVSMSHGELLRLTEYNNFVYAQYSDGPDSLIGTGPMVIGLPLSHLAALGPCLVGLMNGRRTFLLSYFLPDLYLRLIEEIRATFILLVPSLYRSLLNEPYLQHMDKSALRFCISGGEACPDGLSEQIEAAFGTPHVAAYGMTECMSGIAHSRHDLFGRRVKRGSCGKPLFGEVSLRDAHGREHPSQGELWVRNATVHRCYLDARLNAERLSGGWFKSGDMFIKDEDGNFFHRGRADDMFVCNGKNIYPLEMELLLMKHPAVEQVCAAPLYTAEKGTVPAVLIATRHPVCETEVQDFSMRNGASHTIPQMVLLVDRMPLIGPGKIDRQRARSMLQQAYDQNRITLPTRR